MNLVTRAIWLIINLLYGAVLASILFFWVACDMHIPLIIKNLIPSGSSILNVPYVQIYQLSSSVVSKLLFNAFLYAIFGFMHTFCAQEFVQVILGRFLFPRETLRTVYCVIVSITVFVLIGFWQHTHVQLWNWLPSTMTTYQQQTILLIVYSIIYAPGCYVLFKFNPFEFCGLTQLFNRIDNSKCPYPSSVKSEPRTVGTRALITSGVFRLCRHPLYLFTILAWTVTPVMSLDRLAFIVYTCLYLFIGIPIEERKLVQIFGQAYIDYQQRVPALIPFPRSKLKQT